MTLKDINFSIAMYGTTPISQSTYEVGYTGDESSINVKFTVTDEADLAGATAKLHLYFADSSHIVRDMTLTGLVFNYTLVGTENDHAGVVRADIIITKSGAKYTRAGHRFRIDTSLEASAPLVEYAIDTLDTLVDGAEEWLLQAQTDFGTAQSQRADEWVADNDTRSDEFTAAQTSRAETFTASEADRTSTFNTNETGRSNTFTTNENARQAAADSGELARDASYMDAEANRDSQFTATEAIRSDQEAGRVSAESARVTAEAARVTEYKTLADDLVATLNAADANIEEFDIALQNGIVATNIAAELQNLEETYAPELVTVKQQLEQTNVLSAEAVAKADAMASGSPKGVYATLALLQAAYPTGTTGAYLVTADGKWYYWSGSAWTMGGVYQATGIADGAVTPAALSFNWGVLIKSGDITVNLAAKTVSNNATFVADGITTRSIPAQSIDITTVYANGAFYCYYNPTTTSLVATGSPSLPVGAIVLFICYQNKIYGVNTNRINLLDTTGKKVISSDFYFEKSSILNESLLFNWAVVIQDDKIVVDFSTNTINISACWALNGGSLKQIPPTFIDISAISGVQYCYLNMTTNTFVLSTSAPVANSLMLFMLYNGSVFGMNNKAIKIVNPDKSLENYSPVTPFKDTLDRMILHNKMYFLAEKPLPIYKESILVSDNYKNNIKLAVTNIDNVTQEPNYKYFYEDYLLNPTELQNTFNIEMTDTTNREYNYSMSITKNVVSQAIVSGKNVKMLNIGDSLTQNNVAVMLKDKLISLGATVKMCGTKVDPDCFQTEGRGNWTFSNFIGRSSNASTYIDLYPSGNSTTNWQNPFLKLATEEDKTNTPNWCFRHSPSPGVALEKSYATDTDKTGDFYIFDFAWYLSAHGLETPDLVTIALGTNDGSDLVGARLGLEVMIKQIKKALPNVKIGVIPQPAYGSSAGGHASFRDVYSVWIENAMTDVKTYQSTYNNLFIVPVWQHMNRDFIFDYATSTNLSSVNNVQKKLRTERIHFNAQGKVQYVNAMTAFVANII